MSKKIIYGLLGLAAIAGTSSGALAVTAGSNAAGAAEWPVQVTASPSCNSDGIVVINGSAVNTGESGSIDVTMNTIYGPDGPKTTTVGSTPADGAYFTVLTHLTSVDQSNVTFVVSWSDGPAGQGEIVVTSAALDCSTPTTLPVTTTTAKTTTTTAPSTTTTQPASPPTTTPSPAATTPPTPVIIKGATK
jgi:hypothetical protein